MTAAAATVAACMLAVLTATAAVPRARDLSRLAPGRERAVVPRRAPGPLARRARRVLWPPARAALCTRAPRLVMVAAPVAAAVVVTASTGAGPVAFAAAVLSALAARMWLQAPAARRAAVAADSVPEMLIALAAELRAGRSPTEALRAVAAHVPEAFRDAFSAGASPSLERGRVAANVLEVPIPTQGSDQPTGHAVHAAAVLRALAATPGAAGLALAAAAFEVASQAGAPLADVLERVADGLRADALVRQRTAALLAGPRSTAVVLAALPLVALVMGQGIGARPLTVLAGPVGWACLGLGVPLLVAGVAWTDMLARRVERAVQILPP